MFPNLLRASPALWLAVLVTCGAGLVGQACKSNTAGGSGGRESSVGGAGGAGVGSGRGGAGVGGAGGGLPPGCTAIEVITCSSTFLTPTAVVDCSQCPSNRPQCVPASAGEFYCFESDAMSCNDPTYPDGHCCTGCTCRSPGCCAASETCGPCNAKGVATNPCQCAPQTPEATCAGAFSGQGAVCGTVDNCGTPVECTCPAGRTCTGGKCTYPCSPCGAFFGNIGGTDPGGIPVGLCSGQSTTLFNSLLNCGCTSNNCSVMSSTNAGCACDVKFTGGESGSALNSWFDHNCGACIYDGVGAEGESFYTPPPACSADLAACLADGCVALGGACDIYQTCCGALGAVVSSVTTTCAAGKCTACAAPGPGATGGACGTDMDCCAGVCTMGTCQCLASLGSCTSDLDCCAGLHCVGSAPAQCR